MNSDNNNGLKKMSFNEILKKLKEGDVSLLGVVEYDELQLKRFGAELNWKGTGRKDDPFIVEGSNIIHQKISILKNNLYIKFFNCKFDHLILDNCQNISIVNCPIEVLNLVNSARNKFKSSKISSLYLHCSMSNLFEECKIKKAINLSSRENIFQDCTLSEEVLKVLQREKPRRRQLFMIYGFPILIIVSVLMVFFFWATIISIIIILIIFYLLNLRKRKIIEKSPTNQIISPNLKKNSNFFRNKQME